MAWYEQLDLDFGAITDQFTDLIGEASTLLENANNLDILNLDAMAVQEELNQELEEDDGLEYEEESEVIHHDAGFSDQPEVVHHYDAPTEQDDEERYAHQSVSTPERYSSHSHTQFNEQISVSVPSTATKHLHFSETDHIPTVQEENRPENEDNEDIDTADTNPASSGLDDSFAWDVMDNKTPKKSTKLLSQICSHGDQGNANKLNSVSGEEDNTIAIDSTDIVTVSADSSANNHNVPSVDGHAANSVTAPLSPARNAQSTIHNSTLHSTPNNATTNSSNTNTKSSNTHTSTTATTTSNNTAVSKGGSGAVKTKPLPEDTTTTSAVGRKARPLKQKPKVSKEFDFWGVNSTKKTLNFPTAGSSNSNNGVNSSSSTGNSAVSGGTNSNGINDTHTGDSAGSVSSNVNNSNTEHFYGVVGLFGDDYITDEPDIESNSNTTHHDATSTHTTTINTNNTTNTTTHHRLPLGWLSNIITTTTDTTTSFFDDIENEQEDPILKQVELNKTNPHISGESNVDKLWSMWESMVGDDNTTNTSASDKNASRDTNVTTTSSSGKPNLSIFIPVETPGTGPPWVVSSLNWLKYLTGVTLLVLHCNSNGDSSSNVVYSADTRTEPNTNYPHWNLFTVRLTQPIDYTYKPLLLFTLSIIRLLLIILLSLVLRLVVFVYKLLAKCTMHCISYLRTTRLGSRVSSGSARLRQFFSNDSVNNILGGDAPADQSWQGQMQESLQAWGNFAYEQLNSTNAILLLTAVLFLYSYFRFQRYGTDAGD